MEKVIICIAVVCAFCIMEWMRELHTFQITHYNIHSPKLNGFQKERKIVFLSDLHSHCYGKENEKLLSAIRAEKPDLILIGGDMLIGRPGDSAKTAEQFVSKLPEIACVYYANGNHEHRMKESPQKYGCVYQNYKEALVQSGVNFLENEKTEWIWDGVPISLYGMEIPQSCYTRMKKVPFSADDMEKLLGKKTASYSILLAHNPVYTPVYLQWGVDLSLSGHLHGGVMRIPYLGGIITPQMKLFPKYSGELTVEEQSSVVVSKGLGTHTINVRFLNPAEMIVLHLNGEA